MKNHQVLNIHKLIIKRKEQKMQRFLGNTEKQAYVVELLNKNVDMPTRYIIADYEDMAGIDTLSARYVQKIRKWYKELKEKGENNMCKEDVFDSNDAIHEWQLNIINMANEGGWSLQQIAEKSLKDVEEVKETLTTFHYLITDNVLDEDSDDVYFIFKNAVGRDGGIHPSLKVQSRLPEKEEPVDDGDYWEVKIDCVKSCSKSEGDVDVFISKDARGKAMKFMKWAKRREWLAYLIGEKNDEGYLVHDLYLPDQRTSQTLVDKVVAEQYNQMKVVGVIHSHHEMGAGDEDSPSFSGHDAEFINGNHNLSLLAGKNGTGFKIVGIARVKTPCGSLMQVKACIKAMQESLDGDEKALQDEFFLKVFDKKSNKKGAYHFTNNPEI